jgi:hypothetical protein
LLHSEGAEIKMVVRSSFSQHSSSFVSQFVDGHDRCNVPTRHAKCDRKSTAFKKFEDLREARHPDTRDAGRRPCATATHFPPKITISRVKTNLQRPLFF